jgi:hypothetical protein
MKGCASDLGEDLNGGQALDFSIRGQALDFSIRGSGPRFLDSGVRPSIVRFCESDFHSLLSVSPVSVVFLFRPSVLPTPGLRRCLVATHVAPCSLCQ